MEGLISGGAYKHNKNKRFEMSHSSVDRNTFLIHQFLIILLTFETSK